MDSFILRVFIYGLVAVSGQPDGSQDVLLLKTDQSKECERHYPILAGRGCGCQDLAPPTQNAANCDTPPGPANACQYQTNNQHAFYQLAWFNFQDEELSFRFPGATVTADPTVAVARAGSPALSPPELRRPRNAQEAKVLDWTLPLSEMLGPSGNYDLHHVAARLKLKGGELSTCSLAQLNPRSENSKARVPILKMKDPRTGKTWKQVIAESLVWERTIDAPYMDVKADSFSSNPKKPSRSVRLFPQTCSPTDPSSPTDPRKCIDIYLANVPPGDAAINERCDTNGDGAMNHLAHFYMLFGKLDQYAETNSPTISWFQRHFGSTRAYTCEQLRGHPLPYIKELSRNPFDTPSDRTVCHIVR